MHGSDISADDLEAFVLAASYGSFREAALKCGWSASTLSRRIARLEEDLGVLLFLREPNSLTLTDAGREAQEFFAPSVEELSRRKVLFRDRRGTDKNIRITVPSEVAAAPFFADLLCKAIATQQWTIDVVVAQRWLTSAEESVDFALRLSFALPDSSMKVRRLASTRAGVFAAPVFSPRLCAEPGVLPPTLPTLSLRQSSLRTEWPLVSLGHSRRDASKELSLRVTPSLVASDWQTLLSAARAGVGAALLPVFMAAPFVEIGELVDVLPGYRTPPGQLSLLWLCAEESSGPRRSFANFLSREFRKFWPEKT